MCHGSGSRRYSTTSDRGGAESRSGPCYFDGLFGSLFIDCWGGNYAQVNYRFSLPDDAGRISRRIVGDVACCEPGSIYLLVDRDQGPCARDGVAGLLDRPCEDTYQHRVRVRTVTTYYDSGAGTWTGVLPPT
jgi:hypothetical protein